MLDHHNKTILNWRSVNVDICANMCGVSENGNHLFHACDANVPYPSDEIAKVRVSCVGLGVFQCFGMRSSIIEMCRCSGFRVREFGSNEDVAKKEFAQCGQSKPSPIRISHKAAWPKFGGAFGFPQ